MAHFIHTADWQIGKPYRQIADEQKRFKLQQERLNAIGRIRELVNAAPGNGLADHLEAEARAINLARFGAEAKEGLSAFLEKRRPDFSGL